MMPDIDGFEVLETIREGSNVPPIIDRNPQTFVPNIFEAKTNDFRTATHRIHRSATHPSHVSIPVVVRPGA